MWVAGVTQGLMWRAENEVTGGLMYPNFVETVIALRPMYVMRLIGGSLYLVGFLMLAWNIWMTAKSGKAVDTEVEVAVAEKKEDELPWTGLVFGKPMLVVYGTVAATLTIGFLNETLATVALIVAATIGIGGSIAIIRGRKEGMPAWHALLEGRALIFTVLVVVGVLVGGVAEIIPLVITTTEDARATENVPYTSLELHGRDVYLSEGCYVCHSQMVRPFAWETARYGNRYSTLDDSIYDHPFQWGSKRTGPDLAHEGGLRSDDWHYQHLVDPRQITPGSLMPPYAHLLDSRIDLDMTAAKMRAMRSVGVPYSADDIQSGADDARAAGQVIADGLREKGFEAAPDSHMVALIAYLQRLGKLPADNEGDDGEEAVALNQAE